MYKSLPLIVLAALSAPTLIAASSDWQSTPPPPPPPPAPPAHQPWEDAPPPPPPAHQSWEAAPAPAPVHSIHIIFQGANPPVAQYERDVPTNGQPYYPGDPLSISHIVSDNSAQCTFYGIDGLVLTKAAPGLIDVGPPQTITKVVCNAGGSYKAKRFVA